MNSSFFEYAGSGECTAAQAVQTYLDVVQKSTTGPVRAPGASSDYGAGTQSARSIDTGAIPRSITLQKGGSSISCSDGSDSGVGLSGGWG